MQHFRKLGMMLINGRAFAIAGMSMIEVRKEGWLFRSVTGISFSLNPVEADMLKQEIMTSRGNIIPISSAKYQSPLDCFRALYWIVLPYRAFSPQSITAIELIRTTETEQHYKVTFMNNLQVELDAEETKYFDREVMNIIYESQVMMSKMQQ